MLTLVLLLRGVVLAYNTDNRRVESWRHQLVVRRRKGVANGVDIKAMHSAQQLTREGDGRGDSWRCGSSSSSSSSSSSAIRTSRSCSSRAVPSRTTATILVWVFVAYPYLQQQRVSSLRVARLHDGDAHKQVFHWTQQA